MPEKFVINKSYNKSRFDKWFKEEVINLPNSLIQKLLRKNQIKVNNKRIKSSFRLSEGDNISIFNLSKYKPTDFKKKIQYLPSVKERKGIDNFVIYDDDDYIVINKPLMYELLTEAMGPFGQAMGPPWSGAGVGVGILRGMFEDLKDFKK